MAVRTSAGTTIGVSATAPATFNVVGYEALTFVNIGEVTDLGEFGREYTEVTHNPIGTRSTETYKGSFSEGSIDMQVGLDTEDPGQILMKTASTSDAAYYFKITTQNGDAYYFSARVMSFKVSVGGVDDITTASIMLRLTSSSGGIGIVEDLAA